MKKKQFFFITLAVIISAFTFLQRPQNVCAAAGEMCCNPQAQDNSTPGQVSFSYWEYNSSIGRCQQVVQNQEPDGSFTRIDTPNLGDKNCVDQCVNQGYHNIDIAGRQWPVYKYICGSAPVPLPDTNGATMCCDYNDPTVMYEPTTKQCIRYARENSGLLRPIPGGESPTKCGANLECRSAGVINAPDGRPFYICSTTTTDIVGCGSTSDPNESCINTAFGVIHTDQKGFLKQFLSLGIGVGSGIAFLQIALGTFKMVTSQGNPESIAAAKDTITSAIIGLVFIVLSVTILQIVGVDILGLRSYGF